MGNKIENVFYTDDDADDHYIFNIALAQELPEAKLHEFYSCGDLLKHLHSSVIPDPDIIFLDQNMPGNTGNECLESIKKLARLKHVPVVLYTTGGQPETAEKALKLGAMKYVIKPVSIQEVRKAMAEIIRECERLNG